MKIPKAPNLDLTQPYDKQWDKNNYYTVVMRWEGFFHPWIAYLDWESKFLERLRT